MMYQGSSRSLRARAPRALGALACFALLSFGASPAPADDPVLGQREIEESLTCQCGCGLTVATCNHLECSFAVPVRKDIAESLARGDSGQQILERYKTEYGEKVLSSPVPEGFNILAWIAPYAAIVVAGFVMFRFFRARATRVEPAVATAPPVTPAATDDRIAQLRHEVEELER